MFDYQCFTYPWHFHSEYEIIYIKEGYGSRFIGDHVGKYTDGDIILIGSNVPHYMKSADIYISGNSDFRVKGTIIQFEKDFMHYSVSHYPHFLKIKKLLEESRHGIYFPSGCSSKLVEILERISLETGIDQITSLLQLLNGMSEIDIRQVISSSDYVNANDAFYDTSRIDKIISYLNKNYIRSVDLEEIASLAAMNKSAFCRFFKNKTGRSFKKYILDMRISHACKLLIIDDMTISQISTECGFDTISHFNKVFKKIAGRTPSQYKKQVLLL